MFERIISFSIKYKPIVGFLVVAMAGLGVWAMLQVPIDAVPVTFPITKLKLEN
jgi:cobalt-zinc-cadmium resistance protein CzcA